MTRCTATAADPSAPNRIITCESPNDEHEGLHHAHGHADGRVHTWGRTEQRKWPSPDDDLWLAYRSGDPLQIAAARGRYSDKLIREGFPGLNDGLPIDGGS